MENFERNSAKTCYKLVINLVKQGNSYRKVQEVTNNSLRQ